MNLPRLRELVQMGKDGSIRPEELKELFESLPELIKRVDHEPIFCTFCGKTSGVGCMLRMHAHCNFCDPIVPYKCGDPACDCAK